ncbi:MAG TPA: amidohydrolase family protein [Steroidobacteraceae bacterium]|nr:amidohydrolase family protein [Steroidobacteraceae bacterium]
MKSVYRVIACAGLTAGILTAHNASAQEFVIRGATVHTASTKGTLKNTDVVVRGGVIVAIGSDAGGSNATTIDAKGKELTPGLFGGLTDVGIEEIGAESETVDSTLNQKSPDWDQQWRPELDVTVAFNPRSFVIPVTRVEGVTWTVLTPNAGDSIIAGQGSAVSLDGRYDAALPGSRSLFVQMGAAGAKVAGGTRAAEYMLFDQAIHEARAPGPVGQGALLHAAGREALNRYLMGGRVVFQVDRASDIREVVAFAARNGIKAVILGGDEAWLVAKDLAKANVPVILNPLNDLPLDFDRLASSLENAARLQRAGVRIAFSSGDTPQARLTRQLAGNAVAHGLPWESALAAITSTPADIFGVGATHGRIAVGQAADLVLWNGDPLEVSTLAEQVWIGGKRIEMKSRQTELRDRYVEKVKAHQAR